MKAVVVYESMYGNTRRIAEAVAAGLGVSVNSDVVLARDVPGVDLDGVDLLVVGGPTHAWSMSRARTRQGAVADSVKHPKHHLEPKPLDPGVREWLAGIDHNQYGCRAVAFDTRFDKPRWITGSAARAIQRRLRAAGFARLAKPHSFKVSGVAGPLVAGELERAEEWGHALGRNLDLLKSPQPRATGM